MSSIRSAIAWSRSPLACWYRSAAAGDECPDDTHEDPAFFASVTEVREALRAVEA